MTLWIAVIGASLVVWALKSAGYVVPQRFVESAVMSRVAAVVTVALLASLVVSQTIH
ncbi:MAG: AzlD domain-containing protein, partial [Actinobacteria bacterium]|nr:AzlD domain-containing protein [Actinomycetota bacterium]